ncbi:MAG: hypothetical protein JW839_02820 [Candidatus Lokiarchaeota archaeon]|nr:hypothetical protein [Candidatus Lokiarchaeota archaeon]
MSVDPDEFFSTLPEGTTGIACHTSGTSGGAVKWYPMTRDIVSRLWLPGMRAIYESSGMTGAATPIVFVPSRAAGDGLERRGTARNVRLYSSEFSQRLVIAAFLPSRYLVAEYKNATSVPVIGRMLDLDSVSIVSAPSATVLGWASEKVLEKGLVASMDHTDPTSLDGEAAMLAKRLAIGDPSQVALEVRNRLSEKLSDATVIFSTSNLTNGQWAKIRAFMRWSPGIDRFTNLYVGSEVGPFAGSIGHDRVGHTACNEMRVFPLTLPCVDTGKELLVISRVKQKRGRLLVSRIGHGRLFLNVDTGDFLQGISEDGLPVLRGDVQRDEFPLKPSATLPSLLRDLVGYQIYAGDRFAIDGGEITNPARLIECLSGRGYPVIEPLIFLEPASPGGSWKVLAHVKGAIAGNNARDWRTAILSCTGSSSNGNGLEGVPIECDVLPQDPWDGPSRKKTLEAVRKGTLPKGALKRWPAYVARRARDHA